MLIYLFNDVHIQLILNSKPVQENIIRHPVLPKILKKFFLGYTVECRLFICFLKIPVVVPQLLLLKGITIRDNFL